MHLRFVRYFTCLVVPTDSFALFSSSFLFACLIVFSCCSVTALHSSGSSLLLAIAQQWFRSRRFFAQLQRHGCYPLSYLDRIQCDWRRVRFLCVDGTNTGTSSAAIPSSDWKYT